MERLRLLVDRFPGQPLLDTAVSRALLQGVAEGRLPATLRLYRPDDVLAFSVLDRSTEGFDDATWIARDMGFVPVVRLAGGRAAVFHTETLAFAWSRPTAELRDGIEARYAEIAEILVEALQSLGVDARVGEVAGEYCPGRYSVNAGGRVKLAGVGQRVVRGAAHVGGVVVVAGAGRVRDVLAPIYRALGQSFLPETTGAVSDEAREVGVPEVSAALERSFGSRFDVVAEGVDAVTLERARSLVPEHEARPRALGPRARALPGVPKGVVESS